MYGDGTKNNETIIETTNDFNDDEIILCTARNYMEIRGITFKNNGSGRCLTMHGENCEIYENHFISNEECVKITGANTKLHDNQITSISTNHFAIIVSTSTVHTDMININSQVYNNYVGGLSSGIKIIDENNHRIEGLFINNNILVGTGSFGIEVQTSLYLNISNNMIDGYDNLIYFNRVNNIDGIQINNNYLGNGSNHGNGIICDSNDINWLSNVYLANNKAMNSNNFALFRTKCTSINISNNDIYGYAGAETGITLAKCKNAIVNGNNLERIIEQVPGEIIEFVEENIITTTPGTDMETASQILQENKIEKLPVVDKDGKIVYSHTGYTPGGEYELFEIIKTLQ